MGLTSRMLCVVCIGLLSAEFSTVNTGLGRPMFWKPLCLLSIPEGLATTHYNINLCLSQFQLCTYPGNPRGLAQNILPGDRDLAFESCPGAGNSTRAGIL